MGLDKEKLASLYDDDMSDDQKTADDQEQVVDESNNPVGEPSDSPAEDADPLGELAAELGFDKDEIELFRKKGTLEKRVAEAAKAQGKLDSQETSSSPTATEKKPPSESFKLESFPEFETEGEDAYDPKVVQLAAATKSQIIALNEAREKLEAELNHLRLIQAVARFDRLVADAPKEFLDDLGGAVDTEELPVDSQAYKNRVKLFKELELQRELHEKRGEPANTRQLFRKSLDAVFGKKGHSDVVNELLKKRKITPVNRPVPRKGPATSDQHTNHVLNKIAERVGIPVGLDSDADPFL